LNSTWLLRHQRYAEVRPSSSDCHAGAVDEQVALDQAVLARAQAGDVAVRLGADVLDVVGTWRTPSFSAVLAQEQAELAGVEVVAVVGDGGEFRRGACFGARPCTHRRLEADQVGEGHAGPAVAALPGRGQVGVAVALRQAKGWK
jgi:hypothetical protein